MILTLRKAGMDDMITIINNKTVTFPLIYLKSSL